MKQYISMAIQIFIIGLLLFSCHKDTVKSNVKASEYFPNSVGDYWEYDVYDSSDVREHSQFPRQYSVMIKIVGTRALPDGIDATIWQYTYPWGGDTDYIRLVGDTIKVFQASYIEIPLGLEYPSLIYSIPFSVDQRWNGKLAYIDTFHVYSALVVNTPFATYNNCFDIYHYYYGPNIEYVDNYWFKPNIGMVKIHYNDYNFAPYNKYLWQLKKYYLK